MLHFRTDISKITSMIIIAAHSTCRNLDLSAFFTLIIQISQILRYYSIYCTCTEEIKRYSREDLNRRRLALETDNYLPIPGLHVVLFQRAFRRALGILAIKAELGTVTRANDTA